MEKRKLTRKEKFSHPPEPKTALKGNPGKNRWLAPVVLALLAVVLYGNTLNHHFTLDDYSVILENRVTRQGISAIPEIFSTSYRYGYYFTSDNLYRPVVKSMYAIEWSLSPGNAFPGHLVNLILYALTGIVLYRGIKKMTDGNELLAFMTAALFIAHPIHTEVVANIKSRDEMLAFLFSFMALDRFVGYLKKGGNAKLVTASLLYFIALLSKESAITFLAVFPLAGWYFTQQKQAVNLKASAALLAVAGLFLMIRAAVLNDAGPPESVSVADNLLMAAKDPVTRFATAVLILGLYLKLLIFPHPLVFDYSFNQIPLSGPGDPWFLLSAFVYTGILVFALMKMRSKNIFSFAVLFYLVTLSVSSNIFVTIGSSMGERFLYAPSFGFCLALGAAFQQFLARVDTPVNKRFWESFSANKALLAVMIAVIFLYGFKTITRNPAWKDNYTLYANDVNLSPNSTRTHYYLGNYLVKPEALEGKGENERKEILYRGISELKKSIEIYPGFADAHTQMGVAYFKLNNLDSALICYRKALELNPGFATIHNNIGTVYFTKQQYPEALESFLHATRLDPRYAEAHANAGSAYGMMQQYDNALNSLFTAVKWDPNYAQAFYFIGLTYRFKGDEANAGIYLEKAYKLDPALRPRE